MKNLSYIVLLSLLVSFAASCEDDDLQPDTALARLNREVPITTNGADRVGCLINGEVWFNQGGSISRPDSNGSYSSFNERIKVTGSNFNLPERILSEKVAISCHPLIVGSHNLSTNFAGFRRTYVDEEYLYYPLASSNNIFEITHINTIQKILAGTFSMTVVNEDLQDTLIITDGRFDVHYQ